MWFGGLFQGFVTAFYIVTRNVKKEGVIFLITFYLQIRHITIYQNIIAAIIEIKR